MQIESDHTSVREAWRELPALLAALPLPPEPRQILGECIFARLNDLDEFVAVRTEVCPALGTRGMRIVFEPSPRLLRLIRALRAKNTEWLIVEHGLNLAKDSSNQRLAADLS
jgi:hypothetical protein